MSIAGSIRDYQRGRVGSSMGPQMATSPLYTTCPLMVADATSQDPGMYLVMNGYGQNCQSAVRPVADRNATYLAVTGGYAADLNAPGINVTYGAGPTDIYHPGYQPEGTPYEITGFIDTENNLHGTLDPRIIPDFGPLTVDGRLDPLLPYYDALDGSVQQANGLPTIAPTPVANPVYHARHFSDLHSDTYVRARPKVSKYDELRH